MYNIYALPLAKIPARRMGLARKTIEGIGLSDASTTVIRNCTRKLPQ